MELLAPEKLRIIFDADDMTRLEITYSALDYKNKKTRKIFWEAIEIAKKEIGFDPVGSKLLIEAFPEKGGGLSLYVTKLELLNSFSRDTDFLLKQIENYETFIYKFRSINDLLDSVYLFSKINFRILESSLYEANDCFYLIFFIALPYDKKLMKSLEYSLSEYADKESNPLFETYLKEYGKTITEDIAIPKLLEGLKL